MRSSWKIPVLVVSLSTVLTQMSLGQVPPNQVVRFKIHASPTDPLSPVAFVITMNLAASDGSGNVVGWMVTSIEFRQPGAGSAPDQTWIAAYPILPTIDGLWWVEHVDPFAPQLSEFSQPPRLGGTAVVQSAATENLNYSFQGRPYSPPPTGAPFLQTAALTYTLALADTQWPVKDGTDEPVESAGVIE
jgi:hypothetical protein